MKKLLLWLLLLINGPMVAMFCGCLCEDDEDSRSSISHDVYLPSPVLQKCVKDSDNNSLTYYYNRSSKRWNLINKWIFKTDKENTSIHMYYLVSQYYGWAEKWEYDYEYRNSILGGFYTYEPPGKLLETFTLEQYYRLDLKENGQFVTGLDE